MGGGGGSCLFLISILSGSTWLVESNIRKKKKDWEIGNGLQILRENGI